MKKFLLLSTLKWSVTHHFIIRILELELILFVLSLGLIPELYIQTIMEDMKEMTALGIISTTTRLVYLTSIMKKKRRVIIRFAATDTIPTL